jgi:thiamine-phosphate pyrophosphorylase
VTPTPRLLVFTDLGLVAELQLLERVERAAKAARAGALLVILRDKELSARERLRFGAELARLARKHHQLFGVAERLDIALALGADAVHLGEDSVDAWDARKLVGGSAFVSRACHDPDRAGEVDADAVVLSPIVSARKGSPALGLAALAHAKERCGKRLLYALGGVDAASAGPCVAAGADGVAVIGAVLQAEPEPLIAALGLAQSAADSNHS